VSTASEHAGETGGALRAAAEIADPYLRADADLGAAAANRRCADRLLGCKAARCAEIARRLEAGCEGTERTTLRGSPTPACSRRSSP
jgi:hypothetical protein